MIDVIDRFVPVLDRIAFRHLAVAEPFDLRKNEPDPVCFFFLRAIPGERRHTLLPGPWGLRKRSSGLCIDPKPLRTTAKRQNHFARSVCEIGVIGAKAENVRGIWGRETNVDR